MQEGFGEDAADAVRVLHDHAGHGQGRPQPFMGRGARLFADPMGKGPSVGPVPTQERLELEALACPALGKADDEVGGKTARNAAAPHDVEERVHLLAAVAAERLQLGALGGGVGGDLAAEGREQIDGDLQTPPGEALEECLDLGI